MTKTDTTKFSVKADILDPEDGESAIVAQGLTDGEWDVCVLGRYASIQRAQTELRTRKAYFERIGREALEDTYARR
jgi:hypothetical protein